MPSIDLLGVHYAHSDSVSLLCDVTLRLEPGWTGVVGPNGCGKTTLLRLLAGHLRPEAGSVQCHPATTSVHLCEQEVELQDGSLQEFADADGSDAHRLRGRLDLGPEQLERWPTLSPGERKRWQIAAALARQPGALLLDEPTNHLDAHARRDLLAALAEFRGIGVVVSHDRTLLEQLTERTIRIDGGSAQLYRGAYEQARTSWEAALQEELASYQRLRHERDKERKRLADKRRARAQAESRMRTSKNMKNAKDSDARLRGKQKRRRSAEVSLGRDVQLSRRRLGRIDEGLASYRFDKKLGSALFVDFARARSEHLLTRPRGPLSRGGHSLAELPELTLARDSRIHLAGANGAGKTSLLEELLAASTLPGERVLHLPQELGEADALALLDEARRLDPESRGRLLEVVAALGVDPESLLASERPSPGEARKLALAGGLARQVFALVLDEPTNHLDLPSIERLEEALDAYPGALLLVSHDATFAARLCDERWQLEEGRLEVVRSG